jgi:DTW domain-containing protein YfiP
VTAILAEPRAHRPRCYRCLRPETMCWCAELPTVPTRTRFVVLQHPHERQHPFGTARIVDMCMPNASLHTAYAGMGGPLRCDVELPADAAVLFPHTNAIDLAELPPSERPSTLVLLDGTWAHAKRLHRENPQLAALPHVRLSPSRPSRYRIRREPREDYVSTLEAIVETLAIVEPEAPAHHLLTAFERMVDQQIDHVAGVARSGRAKRERQRESRVLSPLLRDPRLVVAYAETSLPGGDPSAARELVHWVAARVHGGETFEALIRPAGAFPSLHHLQHMQLSADDLAGGDSLDEARARWRAFAGGAPVAAWTHTTFDWAVPLLGAHTRHTVLKTNYCNLKNHAAGLLEHVIAREILEAAPVACRGRAAERLANALAAARWLKSRMS